jgi:UDP:flavonoid glycosyltransferase YjiC (YdhE family)
LQEPNMHRIWVRRGMFRKGSSIPVDSITCFDLLVRPGDALPPALDGIEVGTEQLDVETMLLIEPEGMLDRQAARRRLGLPSDARAVYVQLGAGRINDIESEVRRVVDALHAQPDVHVVLGESMLGARLDVDLDRIHLLRDYPNALYLKAFDASVQAGGYNSFHEMRSLRLPTLFLPNLSTGMDDQVARCNIAVQEGWGCVNLDRSANALAHDVEALLSMEPQPSPAPEANGARSLATQILSLLGEDA